MPSRPLADLSQFDFDSPLFTLKEIQEVNPQRHEFAQLTAVVHIDPELHLAVGYKEITDDEFWVPGHMPGYPLMPGVIQCECAAQLGGFYALKYDVIKCEYMGFGGMKDVRFRKPVLPSCRLDLICQITQIRARKLVYFRFQGFVEAEMMFEGTLSGVAIGKAEDS
ncbi:MAG: 3-hydroxyacyl-ACP dehydratase FabZ family protein [Planctomycetaceae bacterium]|jgi:3-hydroxyacyl-[acyl-carrier-protein] dehydratase